MKILQINAVNGYSSTGRTTIELNDALTKRGHQSYIAYSETIYSDNKHYKIGNKFGKKLHALLSRIFGLQSYFSSYSTMKLISYISKVNPDVVHLRNLHANYIHLGLLLKYLSKKNMIIY